jgi:hypothetical protein
VRGQHLPVLLAADQLPARVTAEAAAELRRHLVAVQRLRAGDDGDRRGGGVREHVHHGVGDVVQRDPRDGHLGRHRVGDDAVLGDQGADQGALRFSMYCAAGATTLPAYGPSRMPFAIRTRASTYGMPISTGGGTRFGLKTTALYRCLGEGLQDVVCVLQRRAAEVGGKVDEDG